jgi:biotin operon repressor
MRMISCDTHIIRKALRLSLNEMAVLCDIFQMSQNPKYNYWCIKSKDKMAEWLDLSRDTVFRAIKTLKDKGYVISNEQGYLKCTEFIYDLEGAQEDIAIYIKSGETEVISAKMQEIRQSENNTTPSEFATIPSENQTMDSTKIRLRPSENHTQDSNKINKEIDNREIELKSEFDKFRRMYKGEGVRGLETEWANFKKRHKDYATVVPNLVKWYETLLKVREAKLARKEFVPEHKVFSTFINGRHWEAAMSLELDFETNDSEPTKVEGVYLHKPSGKYWKEYSADKKKYVCQYNGNFEYNDDGTKIPFEA